MGSVDSSAMDKLVQARNAALENVSLYPQVMEPVLGLVTNSPSLELQRWVADFIAEALASPSLASEDKQKMILQLLPVLRSFLELPSEDVAILRSTVQACASIYPLVFRHIISHPDDSSTWQLMIAIKTIILRKMDSYPPGIRICAVKFIQRVVQTQTPGVIADPRRPEKNEISLALVPRDHPLIPPADLEAETSGLLDRILDILQEDTSDVLLVTAAINCLGALVKSRASIANKIINAILMFNPLKYATSPITTKSKIIIRSLERTIRALLINTLKRNNNHPLSIRMQAYLERLQQARLALFEEASRKRPAPDDLTKASDATKRPRIDAAGQSSIVAPGPVSIAEIFTLTNDPGAQNFDVTIIPHDTVVKLLTPLLSSVDATRLEAAVSAVKGRLLALAQSQADAVNAAAAAAASAFVEDEEEYEPDFQLVEDAEQVKNRLEMESSEDLGIGIPKPSQVHLGPFSLPEPQPLSQGDLNSLNTTMIDNLFARIESAQSLTQQTDVKAGLQRVAANTNDRNSLVTTFSRLLTRPAAGIFAESNGKVQEKEDVNNGLSIPKVQDLSNGGRYKILQYILSDWTRRMEVATIWLTEEWYNDQICKKAYDNRDSKNGSLPPQPNFSRWTLHFLDELSAYIGSEHTKLLIRFVSDVPGLDADIIGKVKHLAIDPERVTMVVTVIHYLTLYRPPVRDICLDALEDLYRSYDGAKTSATPILRKFRPQILEQEVA